VTALRPGTEVPGAGTVIGPGPDAGTSWAVPDDPALAGVVVDHDTHGYHPLTRAEQARRIAHAELILERGVTLTGHRVPGRWRVEYRVHLIGCYCASGEGVVAVETGGVQHDVREIQRSAVALAALRAAIDPLDGTADHRRPATWTPEDRAAFEAVIKAARDMISEEKQQ
jgi:hypothetical protein